MHADERHQVGDALPRGSRARRVSLVLSIALSVGVLSATVTTPAQAAQATPAAAVTPITAANADLAKAIKQVNAKQLAAAKITLKSLRGNVTKANNNAFALIGKPPTDPESDDPPGPPAVIAALALDHRVTMGIVPLFNGRKRDGIVVALRYALWTTHTLRQTMLNKVTGLPPEGAGDDYADGMSDTLPIYSAEVTLVKNGLATYRLYNTGRPGLQAALTRVQLAKKTMNTAYGGGE